MTSGNRPEPSQDMIMLAKAIREELYKAGYSQQDVINFANRILELVAQELRGQHSSAPPPSLS